MSVTAVAKEYLVAIYALHAEGKPVIGARLAERLKVTPPTVTQTLRRLKDQGLVTLEPRITLTEQGRAVAEETLRRQRLSERWLIETLGLDWAEAHDASRAMEAAISPAIAERLNAILGHPTTCPHGNPIPLPGEPAAPEAGVWPLDRIEPGTVVVLERIAEDGEHARELLAYLDRHGLRPGVRLTVAAVEPWAHTITLRSGAEEIVLGTRVADQIWVHPLTAAEAAQPLAAEMSECPDEMQAFVAEVESVASDCPAGHQVGDRFVFGQRTPCGLCGEAFMEMHPHLQGLRERAAQRGNGVAVACPEHGNVIFRLRLTPGAGLDAS
jgi:DtxR family Mn-dependent transcriptional regulator